MAKKMEDGGSEAFPEKLTPGKTEKLKLRCRAVGRGGPSAKAEKLKN
jgi:hypothetical protein